MSASLRIRTRLVRSATVALVLLTSLVALIPPDAAQAAAPLLQQAPDDRPLRTAEAGQPVAGRYIVVLNAGVDPRAVATAFGLTVPDADVYTNVLNGFAANLSRSVLLLLDADPDVGFITPDRTVAATAAVPTGVDRVGADPGGTRAGVPVAVLDTGIAPHPDLTIAGGYNCTSADRAAYGDVDGHGTHVAGTIGANGQVVGVAPGTPLSAVKVLGDNGVGQWSWVICGLDWAVGQGITVANLSLSGASTENPADCNSSALHQAVCNANDRGLRMVVAAGNNAQNTANYVPAAYAQVITVSALADVDGCGGGQGGATGYGPDDSRASFSNVGAAVDVSAPGVNILSTAPNNNFQRLSGTSMAAPHVAALVALFGENYNRDTFSGSGERIALVPGGNTACAAAVLPPAAPAPAPAPAPVTGAPAVAAPPPGAVGDSYRVKEDKTLRRNAPGVLANDSAGAGQSVTLVKRTTKGKLTLGANGGFTYKPKRDVSGVDTFTYRVTDSAGRTAIANVRITIVPRPD